MKLPAPTVGPNGAIGRSAAAQALFDEGIAHLTAGRIEVAVSRLREARRLAPTDPLIAGALQRLAPWASQEPDPAGAGRPGDGGRARQGAHPALSAAAGGPAARQVPTTRRLRATAGRFGKSIRYSPEKQASQ